MTDLLWLAMGIFGVTAVFVAAVTIRKSRPPYRVVTKAQRWITGFVALGLVALAVFCGFSAVRRGADGNTEVVHQQRRFAERSISACLPYRFSDGASCTIV